MRYLRPFKRLTRIKRVTLNRFYSCFLVLCHLPHIFLWLSLSPRCAIIPICVHHPTFVAVPPGRAATSHDNLRREVLCWRSEGYDGCGCRCWWKGALSAIQRACTKEIGSRLQTWWLLVQACYKLWEGGWTEYVFYPRASIVSCMHLMRSYFITLTEWLPLQIHYEDFVELLAAD